MEKTNVIINRFKCNSSVTSYMLFEEMLKIAYSTESGFGFSEVNLVRNTISAKILKDVSASYRIWNADTFSMEKVSYMRIKEILFSIDFSNNYIMVEGGVSCMNTVKQALRNIYWNTFVYTPLQITPLDYINAFHDDKILNNIEELTIDNYKSSEHFLGRFIAKIITPEFDISILDSYRDMITKVKLNLIVDNQDAIIIVGKSNSISLKCSDSVKEKLLEYITKINC